jgi:bifunctional DNA-binding transcriptional regulator/antitoxin component of YhaV-PrlF toxin-antitoxin module
MPVVKMDEKGRIQLPHEVRESWRLKPRQPLSLRVEGETVSMTKVVKPTPDTDPLLRDILVHPLRSKPKVTKGLLDKLEEEQWFR